jgi:hypothetical protein
MADGRVVVDAHITRTGIFEYLDDRGRIRRELREDSEVFSPSSLATFRMVPVTNDHPPVGLVDASNARKYMIGSTGDNVLRDDDHVRATIMVTDADTIRQMEAGKLEVSCGYQCDLDETPGVHPVYGKYDARQRNIRGNHVAIVDSARAGRSARVRMDGAATQINSPAQTRRPQMDPEKSQETIRALGAQLTEAKERADAAEVKAKTSETRADVAEGKLITLESRVSELQSQLATISTATETEAVGRERTRADAAEAKVARFDATVEKRIRARSKLERQVAVVLGDDFRMDDLSDRDIRAAAVKRLDTNADVSKSVPDGVIEGRFLSLLEGYHKNARSNASVAEAIAAEGQNAPRVDAKENAKQRIRDQWKAPLPNDIRAGRTGKDA